MRKRVKELLRLSRTLPENSEEQGAVLAELMDIVKSVKALRISMGVAMNLDEARAALALAATIYVSTAQRVVDDDPVWAEVVKNHPEEANKAKDAETFVREFLPNVHSMPFAVIIASVFSTLLLEEDGDEEEEMPKLDKTFLYRAGSLRDMLEKHRRK